MRSRGADFTVRVVVAACLVISGLIHLHLAKNYSHAGAKVINEATAFRIQAVVVLVLALLVLALPMARRPLWGVVAVVAVGSAAALLISRYSSSTSFPGISPESTWDVGNKYIGLYEKQIALIVELVAFVLAAGGAALFGGRRRVSGSSGSRVAAVRA